MGEELVVVRDFQESRDKEAVEEMEQRCQVGTSRKTSIFVDCMGDPICRIRHSPAHLMLVAEFGMEKEIVGVIRGSIRTVTTGKKQVAEDQSAIEYVKVAYLLGLRVSPSHRRLGIATKLVRKLEEWCKQEGAQYAYIATEHSNIASLNLFTIKCGYSKFRTPAVLVHPVHAHRIPVGRSIAVVRLSPPLAEAIYRRLFLSSSEFFPEDIDAVLANNLNLGTFMAFSKSWLPHWDPLSGRLPPCLALLSVWNHKAICRFQVKGASGLTRMWCSGTRWLDSCLPFARIPSVPNFFKPFGVYLLYGLHMQGKGGEGLMRGLCRFVHNMARKDKGCAAMVAEVGSLDPVKEGVPYWRRFSWAEDMWCIKRISDCSEEGQEVEDSSSTGASDWVRSWPMSPVVFVDPRDF